MSNDFHSNRDYLRHAISVLELMQRAGATHSEIIEAGGEYWITIRKDLIDEGICRPIGKERKYVAPDNKAKIVPTLAHHRYLLDELTKQERDKRLDRRIKKSGAWCGWIAIVISIISLSISMRSCSTRQAGTPIEQCNDKPLSPDAHKNPHTLPYRQRSNSEIQSEHTTSDSLSRSGNVSASKFL